MKKKKLKSTDLRKRKESLLKKPRKRRKNVLLRKNVWKLRNRLK